MTRSPDITPIIAALLFFILEKNPSRKSPSIPPLNIEASFHQVSRALCTLIIAIAVKMLMMLNKKDEEYSIIIGFFPLFSFNDFLK